MRTGNIAIAALILVFFLCSGFQADERPLRPFDLVLDEPGARSGTSRLTLGQWDLTNDTELDAFIIDFMESKHIPGLAASIEKKGEVIWTNAYGSANFTPPTQVTEDTLFLMASISKTFTGVALMQLYEQGKFGLHDPINNYLPFAVNHPKFPGTDITFHMLLTHTASITDHDLQGYPGDPPTPLETYLKEYLCPGGMHYIADKSYGSWEPGTQYSYSNVGVTLIAYLVEVIAVKPSIIPFEDYCLLNIFTPTGMGETSWFLKGLNLNNIAMPYYWNGNTHVSLGHYGLDVWPAAQLRTSAPQLLHYLTTFWRNRYPVDSPDSISSRILNSDTVVMMTTPQIPQLNPNMGLIWQKNTIGGRVLWGHGGGMPGVRTAMWYHPDESTGVVVLTNIQIDHNPILAALFEYAEEH